MSKRLILPAVLSMLSKDKGGDRVKIPSHKIEKKEEEKPEQISKRKLQKMKGKKARKNRGKNRRK